MSDRIVELVKSINKMARDRQLTTVHLRSGGKTISIGWVGAIPSYALTYADGQHRFKADRIGVDAMEMGFIDTDDMDKAEEMLRLEAVKLALEID